MKEFRLSKGCTEHYTSLDALREGFGLKKVSKQTKDKDKLIAQREKFCSHYKCRACGSPMTWMGESIMCCTNDACRGIKNERTDTDGNVIVTYSTSYQLLDDHFAEVANNIFSETN